MCVRVLLDVKLHSLELRNIGNCLVLAVRFSNTYDVDIANRQLQTMRLTCVSDGSRQSHMSDYALNVCFRWVQTISHVRLCVERVFPMGPDHLTCQTMG